PDTIVLAERDAGGQWRTVRWREMRDAIGRIAQVLLGLRLPAGRPVVVLSDNNVDHALLVLAAIHVGRPACSLSSAYSRLTRDYGRLKGMLNALRPALVYAADAATYGPALEACRVDAVTVIGQGAATFPGALPFSALLDTVEGPDVMAAFEK